MLDATLTQQLATYLENVVQPIELVASVDDSQRSREMVELLQEIVAVSDKVSLTTDGTDARVPSFAINRAGTDIGVRFAGIPMGHEFTSLVLALLHVGGHPVKLSHEVQNQIRDLPSDLHFETYMSLTCQICPDVVQALNAISVLNPGIRHTTIEGGTFQHEVDERNIQAVPTVYLNGELFGQGRMSVEEIISKLDSNADATMAARLNEMDPFEVLIIGGGPAGASAAIYTARKGIRTALVTERFGGQILDTVGIENFISMPYTEGPQLATALEQHVHSYELDVIKHQRAQRLEAHPDGSFTVHLASGAALRGATVIVASGARWRTTGVPGEDEYRNKGVTFCPHCDGPLFKDKRVAVIGGGNSGIEAAIDLAGVVAHVTVVEFLDELRADKVLQSKFHSLPNTDVILGAKTTAVLGDDERVTGLDYEDRTSGQQHHLEVEGVFVQIGLVPNTDWLEGAVELSPRKEIVVDERGATNVPGLFAAGDCTTHPYKQIIIAIGAGATAALSAFDHLIRSTAPQE